MANDLEKKVVSLKLAQRIAIRKILKEFTLLIPELVKARTRLGGGLKGSLPALKESTIKQRAGEIAFARKNGVTYPYVPKNKPKLHPDTSPSESNLTGTGQLLDSIQAKVTEGRIVVTVNEKKRKRELSGASGTLTNNQVRKYVEEAGFNFFDLADDERKHLTDLATQLMIEEIKKVFGK